MYEKGFFMFGDMDLKFVFKRKKFRVYGNTLGSAHDVASLLLSLEKNYNAILAFEKIVINQGRRLLEINRTHKITQQDLKVAYLKLKDYQENKKISDIISENEYLVISKINFNSPGFWEVIGNCNPLFQIRKYIEERHERQKDKEYNWKMDEMRQKAEIDEIQLHNDMMRLTIIKEMNQQLRNLGLSSIEITDILKECYKNLNLLDTHIESERVIRIEEINEN